MDDLINYLYEVNGHLEIEDKKFVSPWDVDLVCEQIKNYLKLCP